MVYLTILIAILTVGLIWFLVSLIWGRPWRIQWLYSREFLRLALDNPELLTYVGLLEKFGYHAHNARLADASDAHEAVLLQRVKRSLRLLRSYDRRRQSPATLLSTDILDYFLDDQARGEPFRHHTYPINQMFGQQSEMPNFMMTVHPLTSRVEARNYNKRLQKFGLKFDQILEGLRLREQMGVLPPRFVIRRVLDEMTAFIGRPARENPLYTVFKEKLTALKLRPVEQEKLLAGAEAALQQTVYPAYQRLIAYFTELEPKANTDDGVWKLPDGDAYYAHCLRSQTTTDLTPAQVHEIGLREVERIEKEMRAILAAQGYGDVQDAPRKLAELGREARFLYPNTDAGRAAALADYQRILDEMNASINRFFAVRPKAALKVERVPAFREQGTSGAYYQEGDLSGARPGVFFANLRDMKEIQKFGMKTLSYHEGIPGHHFQLSIAMELKGIPFFRRFVPFTAYIEGWALYAEKLAREQGFYKDDPYGELGYLDSELLRAVRLVVDTGIHFKHWTREQAIEYMDAHTASAHESVVSEIERYIVMPGQACAYKIGEIQIVAQREKMKKALGEKFDLKAFHDLVLKNGAVPLVLLERIVDEQIGLNTKFTKDH